MHFIQLHNGRRGREGEEGEERREGSDGEVGERDRESPDSFSSSFQTLGNCPKSDHPPPNSEQILGIPPKF